MLAKLIIAAAGGAVGYVLGAKAGRERYEQISDRASRLWRDPNVRDKASQAAENVKDVAEQAKDKANEKVTSADESDTPDDLSSRLGTDQAGSDRSRT